ncbi:Uncharacterised protein [Rikenella microfusus]|uniref:Uncharacterized protein n=1 Tax=Rikenella microfusus TaxID=28139 RepID=A0A379MUT9_9BACT|nr:Uncharacterised protein [Rikenella microfusus]
MRFPAPDSCRIGKSHIPGWMPNGIAPCGDTLRLSVPAWIAFGYVFAFRDKSG